MMWLALVLVVGAAWLLVAGARASSKPRTVRRSPARPIRPAKRSIFRPAPVRPAPSRRSIAEDPHVLYHYPWANRPGRRYIGISNEPERRHAEHLIDPKDRWWMVQSTGVMVLVAQYPTRAAALAAERAAIREAYFADEDPANTVHNPGRKPRAARR